MQFIVVHARHDASVSSSLPTTSVPDLRRLVDEVAVEIALARGKTVTRVVVFSDESNPVWWIKAGTEGWFFINHETERTAKLHGKR